MRCFLNSHRSSETEEYACRVCWHRTLGFMIYIACLVEFPVLSTMFTHYCIGDVCGSPEICGFVFWPDQDWIFISLLFPVISTLVSSWFTYELRKIERLFHDWSSIIFHSTNCGISTVTDDNFGKRSFSRWWTESWNQLWSFRCSAHCLLAPKKIYSHLLLTIHCTVFTYRFSCSYSYKVLH